MGVAGLFVACGPGATQAPPAAENMESPAASASPTSAASSGMDVSGIELCQILTKEEFAELAGGTFIQAAEHTGPTCSYLIDPPGDEPIHTYVVHIQSVDITQPLMDYVRDYEVADWISGLGDEAYVKPAVSGGGFVLEGAGARPVWDRFQRPRPRSDEAGSPGDAATDRALVTGFQGSSGKPQEPSSTRQAGCVRLASSRIGGA